MTENNVEVFVGDTNVLSNFYPCKLKVLGTTQKSVEHAFQYARAIRNGNLGIANKILEARDAKEAKAISKEINYDNQNDSQKTDLMEQLLLEKL